MEKDRRMGKSCSAFSLLETLLASGLVILMTAVGAVQTARMMQSAKAVKCLNNLRQLGTASLCYAADNQGQLPQSSHQGPSRAWTKVLKTYVPATVFHSPLDDSSRTLSYAVNDYTTVNPFGAEAVDFSRLSTIPAPSRTFYMGVLHASQQNSDHFHFAEAGFDPENFAQEVWVDLTNGSSHYLFVDGHAEALRWEIVKTNLCRQDSSFVRPNGVNP